MYVRELTEYEFTYFSSTHILKNYHQTSNYAKLMSKHGFTYEYIGLFDESDILIGASLILFKEVFKFATYGYAPKGLLMDYYNEDIIKNFTSLLRDYYLTKNVAFIRINPEISIGTINYDKEYIIDYNSNRKIINYLKNAGLIMSNNTTGFNSIIPKYNAIIKTSNYDLDKISKQHKNQILKGFRKGLELVKVDEDKLPIFYDFIKKKKNRPLSYYEDYYDCFSDNVDLFLVKINYDQYLINITKAYEEENLKNQQLYNALVRNNNQKHLVAKMESDKLLNEYKNELEEATNGSHDNKETYVAGAFVIRFDNRINIVISGFDKNYKNFAPNPFLHHEIIEYYKKDYKYIELNGITNNKNDKKYKGVNELKLGFKPEAFEFIGEFDIVINKFFYKVINLTKTIKKDLKK
ncbi:MAG: peptidoglycan bridge formation glycyltransferase FemA/FemB family protein [Bacilli bacterium]|nr:peptidoglycan bridge formation glycyltransferase FemA/FemB family protein [Bacilli bacterium]